MLLLLLYAGLKRQKIPTSCRGATPLQSSVRQNHLMFELSYHLTVQ